MSEEDLVIKINDSCVKSIVFYDTLDGHQTELIRLHPETGFTFAKINKYLSLKDYVAIFIKIIKLYRNWGNAPFISLRIEHIELVSICTLHNGSISVSDKLKKVGDVYSYLFCLELEKTNFNL